MKPDAIANCARLRERFEDREAIYIEWGALRVRVTRIQAASSLLRASMGELVQRLGKPSQIDGHRWMYRTSGGTLAVYFDDADTVVDIHPRTFDLSIFKK